MNQPDDRLFKFLDDTVQRLQALSGIVQSRVRLIDGENAKSEGAKLDVELSEMSDLFQGLKKEQTNMNWQFAKAHASLHPTV
jgi:hypothetical protein